MHGHAIRNVRLIALWGTLALVLLCVPGKARAQAQFPIVLDYAGYRLAPDTNQSYVEFYYTIWRDRLTFVQVPNDSILQAEFEVHLLVSDTLGNPVDSVTRSLATRVPSQDEARRRNVTIFDVLPLVVAPGLYRAKLFVRDLIGDADGTFELDSVQVRDYPSAGDTLFMSDLQLAYDIRYVSDTLTSQKVKNGYYIEPNPGGLYAPEDSVVYFYGELYNLLPEPTSFRVHLWILNRAGDVVKEYLAS